MTKFKNATFKSIGSDCTFERKGYTFEYLLADNTVVTLAVYKNDSRVPGMQWCVIDPSVGQALCYGKTRADAVRKADEWREKFTNLRNSTKWNDLVKLFESYEANGGVNPKLKKKPHNRKTLAKAVETKAKEHGANVKATVNDLGDGVTAVVIEPKRLAKPKRKPEPPKTEVKVTRAAIIPTAEGIKAEVIEEHTETVEHKAVEPVAETAAVITLDSMREWCSKHPNTCATKAKGEGAKVRVYGIEKADKAAQAELKELGFRWAKKGFWWAVPTA